MRIANVVIEQTAYSFDKPYGYLIPDSLLSSALPGCRVIVPFGKGDTTRQGIILSTEELKSEISYKTLISVIDTEPVLSEELLSLVEWMHENLFCTYFEAVKAALPVGIGFKVGELYSKGDKPFSAEYSRSRQPLWPRGNSMTRLAISSMNWWSWLAKNRLPG